LEDRDYSVFSSPPSSEMYAAGDYPNQTLRLHTLLLRDGVREVRFERMTLS
jgi:hypothetical protein